MGDELLKPRHTDGRRLRAGIVGGGRGAFIGAVHRMAAELDGEAIVVAGAMASSAEISRQSAAAWFLDRSYDSYTEMAHAEALRSDGIDFVIIATPNHLHFPVAEAFLQQGIAVVCDKPLTHTLLDAEALANLVRESGQLFALTHCYTGYPMVREARDRVRSGALGDVRKVLVEYHQDWLMATMPLGSNKQADWRMDPTRAGIGGCVGDIGTHAENLLEYITDERISALCADLSHFVEGRLLDDDANILLRLTGGGKGVLTCSQVACGEENDLRIRVYGSKAGLEWRQQEPNTLLFKPTAAPWQRVRSGGNSVSASSAAATRLPGGHPEGYLEAFANIYRAVCSDIRRRGRGEPLVGGYPTIEDGVRGMRFISGAVESSRRGSQWIDL